MNEFLRFWFDQCPEGQLLELRPLNKRPGQRPLPQKWCSSADDAADYVRRSLEHGDDCYMGALPRARAAGTADAVGARLWLWGDLDVASVGHKAPTLFKTLDEALASIRSCGIQPTAIVSTGNGLHAWWCLTAEPPASTWTDAMRRLAHAIKADMNALDPPRILRMPSTLNFKTDPPREVRLVEMSGRLIGINDVLCLPAYVEPPATGAGPVHASGSAAPPAGDRPFDRANNEPVAEVLDWLGVRLHREGSRLYCACPVHHGSNTSQMVVGGDSNVATCFGDCGGRAYTPVDLAAAVHRCTPKQAVDLMANRFGFDGFSRRARASPPPEAPAAAEVTPIRPGATTGWEAGFARTREGEVKTTLANVELVLSCAAEFTGKLRYNEMTLAPELDGVAFTDEGLTELRVELERKWRLTPTAQMTDEALRAVARRCSYHPVREYLEGLRWDGHARISAVSTEILGANDEPLTRRLLRAWFISAVARGMAPGSKVDSALVLVGPQGYRKSTFFRELGGPFFIDTALDIGSKDAYLQLAKAWIYELPEIEVITSQKHAGQIKGFVTSQYDSFRPPYGRGIIDKPRSCVIVGTTNEPQFLTDSTGSRRFWVVRVERVVAIDKLKAWRDQLWAEAVVAYRAGEQWWLEAVEDVERETAAENYCVIDPWEEPIANHLAKCTGDITVAGILAALNLATEIQTQAAMNRVGRIMRKLGYETSRRRVHGSGSERRITIWYKSQKGEP